MIGPSPLFAAAAVDYPPDEDTPAPEGYRCLAEGADVAWPCPTFREAAGVIADGLTAVVLP